MKKSLIFVVVIAVLVLGCQSAVQPDGMPVQDDPAQSGDDSNLVVPADVADIDDDLYVDDDDIVLPLPDVEARTGKVGLVNMWGTNPALLDLQRRIVNVNEIDCDKSEGTLSFTLRNPRDLTEGRIWRLDPPVPRGSPSNHVATQISLNGYQVNSPVYHYYRNGQRMFGPNEKFSDNCGGRTQLAGGRTATCSLTNVPLRSQNELNGFNRIFINTPYNQVLFQFTCEE